MSIKVNANVCKQNVKGCNQPKGQNNPSFKAVSVEPAAQKVVKDAILHDVFVNNKVREVGEEDIGQAASKIFNYVTETYKGIMDELGKNLKGNVNISVTPKGTDNFLQIGGELINPAQLVKSPKEVIQSVNHGAKVLN